METKIYVFTPSGKFLGSTGIDTHTEDLSEIVTGHVEQGNIVVFGENITEIDLGAIN